jgi:protein-tyrosine phosphatase
MLDFHNHLMPAVDDGACDLNESREGLETFRSQGVTTVITTPHLRGSMTVHPPELAGFLGVLDEAWEQLSKLAKSEFPDLRVERGVELMLDVPQPVIDDARVRLAGTSFVLVEFPFMSIPPNSTLAIRNIIDAGWNPIVAHPERYANMQPNYGLIESWREAGARIQVNSGSLLGYYGAIPRKLAWAILRDGLAHYLSSDYHSRGKCAVAAAGEHVKARGGEAIWRLLTTTNPDRLLAGKAPLPVPPWLPDDLPIWKRVLPW